MLWLWSPEAPFLGPLKNMKLLLKPNRNDLLTENFFFVSHAQRCWVGSHSNSSKASFHQHETDRANRLYLPQVLVLCNLKHKFNSIHCLYLLSIRPIIQTQLMKPYVCCHLFSWEKSVKTRHLWRDKVWQPSSKTSIKSVKLYTAGFILIHRCCLELISLSPFFSHSCLFLSVHVCLCMSVFLLQKTLILQTSAQGY